MSEQAEQTLFERGMQVRRAVLGDAYVDRSLEGGTEFRKPMQELVTEYCWGAIWSRDGLDRKTRSLVNIGMLTALNRSTELAAHIRGAVNNGATKEEIQEVLLQTAVYCGMPAGLESFRVAEKVFDDLAAED
jgi:4-carboxymuconolactone decarboxylase